MLILNYNNKKYIELTDDKIIFYRLFRKITLRLDNIRACYMDDNYILKILYGNSVKSFSINNVRNTDKVALSILVDKLNKDKMIFSSQYVGVEWAWICYIPFAFMNMKSSNGTWEFIFWSIWLLFMGIVFLYGRECSSVFIYDTNKKLIKVGSNIKNEKIFNITDKNFSFNFKLESNSYEFKYRLEKTINKINGKIIVPTNVIYPIYYKSTLRDLNNLIN